MIIVNLNIKLFLFLKAPSSDTNHSGENGPGAHGSSNPKLRNLQLGGHVGFDSLPDQLVNQSVAAGFTFNIMCIGKTCLSYSIVSKVLHHFKEVDNVLRFSCHQYR